jgi:hypothetical protein
VELFIFYSREAFDLSSAPYRLYVHHGLIEAYSFGEPETWRNFNTAHIHLATDARADVVEDIERLAEQLAGRNLPVNRWIATRDLLGAAHSMVQYAYLDQGFERHVWRRFFTAILSEPQILKFGFYKLQVLVSPMARLVKADLASQPIPIELHIQSNRPAWLRHAWLWLKNRKTESANLLRGQPKYDRQTARARKRILYFVGPTRHLFELFTHFFHLSEVSAKYHVLVVLYNKEFGIGGFETGANNALNSVPHDITTLEDWQPFQMFSTSHKSWFEELSNLSPATRGLSDIDSISYYENWYRALDVAIQDYQPDVVLHNNIYDPGRVLSDVARYHKVPSVNVQYSLFSDLPSNRYSIQFDVRAHINEWTRQLFIRNGGPSLCQEVIGYLKLDEIEEVKIDRPALEQKHGLVSGQRTVFFGSTYNYSYDYEKVVFAERLVAICARHGWNLLIKKHPLERDSLVADAIARSGYTRVRVLTHAEIPLAEAVSISDLITNQSSGLVLEALYYRKPFVYLSLDTSRPEYYKAIDEPFIPLLSTEAEIEAYLVESLTDSGLRRLQEQFEGIREKYLYRTDGKASERLLTIIERLSHPKA